MNLVANLIPLLTEELDFAIQAEIGGGDGGFGLYLFPSLKKIAH